MNAAKKLIIKPDIPFAEYRKISFWHDLRLRFSDSEFRPLILHTRDYTFSEFLPQEFNKPKKLYTRFNIFYLHCGVMYSVLPRHQQKKIDYEIKLLNKHWGMYIYDVIYI